MDLECEHEGTGVMAIDMFYSNPPTRRAAGLASLPPSRHESHRHPKDYLPDEGLVNAVNVALLLAQPLLLTGEPGTGKTELAYSVAWQLGMDPTRDVLKFETKSSSTARELFYFYDALGRFHAAQSSAGSRDPLDYITYNALGVAILRAQPEEAVRQLLPRGFEHTGPRRSIVLIDEIDKASRDLPNDVLSEVEGMYFRISELGNQRVAADPGMKPIVIITSNSERNLPDPFLRRCIYYNVPFPTRDLMLQIVLGRMATMSGIATGAASTRTVDPFTADALDLFFALRNPSLGLKKPPATAELLNWLQVLREMFPSESNPLSRGAWVVGRTLGSLVKTADDQERVGPAVDQWAAERGRQ